MPQSPKSFQQVLQELWQLLTAYARQETLGPLKNLSKQIGWGIGGTFSFSLGYFLITLGVVRFLQTHVEFTATHNYFPYFIACVMLAAAIGVAGMKAKGKGSPAVGHGHTPGAATPGTGPEPGAGPASGDGAPAVAMATAGVTAGSAGAPVVVEAAPATAPLPSRTTETGAAPGEEPAP